MIHTGRKDNGEDSSFSNIKGSCGKINQLKMQQPPITEATTTSFSPLPGEPGSSPPVHSNRLLAGYMAYEFLTQGTVFGQTFDPARAEAVPLAAAEPKLKPTQAGLGPDPKRPKLEPNRSWRNYSRGMVPISLGS